jgi:hypothetical protein
MTLLELAARCEAATGSDRELDFEILCVVDPRAIRTGPLPGDRKYTASIDAAMTLKDDVHVLITLSEIKGDGMPNCIIGNSGTCELFEAVAETPALALTAASLRARASAVADPSHASPATDVLAKGEEG